MLREIRDHDTVMREIPEIFQKAVGSDIGPQEQYKARWEALWYLPKFKKKLGKDEFKQLVKALAEDERDDVRVAIARRIGKWKEVDGAEEIVERLAEDWGCKRELLWEIRHWKHFPIAGEILREMSRSIGYSNWRMVGTFLATIHHWAGIPTARDVVKKLWGIDNSRMPTPLRMEREFILGDHRDLFKRAVDPSVEREEQKEAINEALDSFQRFMLLLSPENISEFVKKTLRDDDVEIRNKTAKSVFKEADKVMDGLRSDEIKPYETESDAERVNLIYHLIEHMYTNRDNIVIGVSQQSRVNEIYPRMKKLVSILKNIKRFELIRDKATEQQDKDRISSISMAIDGLKEKLKGT